MFLVSVQWKTTPPALLLLSQLRLGVSGLLNCGESSIFTIECGTPCQASLGLCFNPWKVYFKYFQRAIVNACTVEPQ